MWDNVLVLRLSMVPHLGRIRRDEETVAEVAEESEPQMPSYMIVQAAVILHDVRTERTKAVTRVLHRRAWRVILELLRRHTGDGGRVQQSVLADHVLLDHVRVRRTQRHALPVVPYHTERPHHSRLERCCFEKVISPNAVFRRSGVLEDPLVRLRIPFPHDAIFLVDVPHAVYIQENTVRGAIRLSMYDE